MIVKNEIDAIKYCLESVKPIIDHWVIVDTGSTDGTQDLIRSCLKGIPGELYERDWVDFATNRNQALDLARGKGDFLFFIDADETLTISLGFNKSSLKENYYYVLAKGAVTNHYRLLLIDRDSRWKWEGVVHEYLTPPPDSQGKVAEGLAIDCSTKNGHRSKDPSKHLKDAQVLEKALRLEPTHARYAYYLAQSFAHAHQFDRSIECYTTASKMPGINPDEQFWALYCIGHLHHLLGSSFFKIIASYCEAVNLSPTRAEPFERLAVYFYEKNWPLLGFLAASHALDFPKVSPLFSASHPWVYDYGLLWIFAECANALGDSTTAKQTYRTLLAKKHLPESIKNTLHMRNL